MAAPETTPKLSCTDQIMQYLDKEFLTLAWLEKKTDIPYATLRSIFVEKRFKLNQERLNLINIACKTDFQLDPPADSTTTA